MAKRDANGLWYLEKATGDTALEGSPLTSHGQRVNNDYIKGAAMGVRWSTYEPTENTFAATETAISANIDFAKVATNWTNGLPRSSRLTLLMGRYAPSWFFDAITTNGGNIAYMTFDPTAVGDIFSETASTTLSGAITDVATSLVVASAANITAVGTDTSGSILRTVAGGTQLYYVTAKSGTTLTVKRGIRGSTAVACADAAVVEIKKGYRTPLVWEVWLGTTQTTLAAQLTAANTTSLTLTSGTGYDTGPGMVKIGTEDIHYASRSGAVCSTLTRARNGTTAAQHEIGATVTNTTLRRKMLNTLQHMKDQGYDDDPYVAAVTIFAGQKVEEIILNDDKNADADYGANDNTWTYHGYTETKHTDAVKQAIDDYHRIFTSSPLTLALNHTPFSGGVGTYSGTDSLQTAYDLIDYVVTNYRARVYPGWTEVDDGIVAPGSDLLARLRTHGAALGATLQFDCGTLSAQTEAAAQAAYNDANLGGRTAFYGLGFSDIAVRVDSIWAITPATAHVAGSTARSGRRRRR